ncbi:MAG: hypothetical protein H6Q34_1070 [Deltaproteobacteria bacterium]|nr:hypothetical protein [Deltaproteobacteria bacterium]
MHIYMRILASVLLFGGLAICVVAAGAAIGDETFFRAGEALARHPDHVLFQGEYYAALFRHIAFILTAIVAALLGTVGSAVLFGLYAVLRRLERLEASLNVSERAR